jgi:hypothetical protein
MQSYIKQAEDIIRSSTKEELDHLFFETPTGRTLIEVMAVSLMTAEGRGERGVVHAAKEQGGEIHHRG